MRNASCVIFAALVLSGCASAAGQTAPTPTPAPTAAPGYRASVLADHPVGYWPMDETSGTVMADASGHGLNGAYAGNVGLARTGPIKATPNAAIALDGAASWASAPNAPSLQVSRASIELWINKRTEVEHGAFVTKNFSWGGGAGTGWFQLLNGGGGHLEFRVASDDATLTSTSLLALNRWYYVVATYDGTTAKLYIDGTLDASASLTVVPKQGDDPIYLGRRSDGLFNDAMLSSVAIYPRALPADRIVKHWQAASAG
jgi:hypothetical protein